MCLRLLYNHTRWIALYLPPGKLGLRFFCHHAAYDVCNWQDDKKPTGIRLLEHIPISLSLLHSFAKNIKQVCSVKCVYKIKFILIMTL